MMEFLSAPVSPICDAKCCPADLLDRQDFVQQVIKIAETLSANNKNACYAINGGWGVGKTFVLEQFEKQIAYIGQERSLLNKYIIFHYNCWEYDYYEEPLIALVAVILDQIDCQVKLIQKAKREKIKAALKIVGHSILQKAKGIIGDKTGIPIEEISQLLNDTDDNAKDQIKASHEFDIYFEFKKILKELSKILAELSQDQTVILVVDELDRCLPEYTIKVLERLHHIFEGVPNTQVILAVDKQQLENTVKQIYGKETSVEHYLEKFIQFEINLNVADTQKIIEQSYPQYLQCFSAESIAIDEINKVCQLLLCGIDIRRSKAIIEKSYLCHRMLTPEGEKPIRSIICIEIFLTILKTFGLNIAGSQAPFRINDVFYAKHTLRNGEKAFSYDISKLTGLQKIADELNRGNGQMLYFNYTTQNNAHINIENTLGLLLASYRIVLGFQNDNWIGAISNRDILAIEYSSQRWISEYVQKFWNFLQIIN